MTATRMHGRGDAVSRERIAPSCACDISAEAFVAKESQRADATCNEEVWFSRLRFHAPKLCLGETHVPQKIF